MKFSELINIIHKYFKIKIPHLGQLGVGRDIGDAIPQVRKGRINAQRSSALLFVGRIPAFDHSHHGHSVGRHRGGGIVISLLVGVSWSD